MNSFILTLNENQITKSLLQDLRRILVSHPGENNVEIKLYSSDKSQYKILELAGFQVEPSLIFLNKIIDLL
jgi:hypothetical protein|tara:strand:+ start:338 stop:550 length:213 start_codon:yes stop_codon:yes gene_type:complete